MAADSLVSPSNVKKNTRSTNALTQEQALEILQQAIINCQHAGIKAHVTKLFHGGVQSVIVVLANCELDDGNIVLATCKRE